MQEKDKHDQLINKYLNGRLSHEETEELASWLNKDPRNKDYFHKVKHEWDPMKNPSEHVQASYRELQTKMSLDRSLNRQLHHSLGSKGPYRRVMQVAAVLIIGLVTGFMAQYLIRKKPKQQVQFTIVEASRGEKSKITLPDSSVVWLNSESSLRFASANFSEHRNVRLKGEAFFSVKPRNNSSFHVKTRDYDIMVTGTKFNVMAYENLDRTETTLVEGKVTILGKDQFIDLKPEQKVTFSQGHFNVAKANIKQSTAWKDDIFHFDEIRMDELISRLERWYDIDIRIADQSLKDEVYSGVFKNEETIWEVLEVIRMTTPIKYQESGFREITITHKSNPKTQSP